MARAAAEQARSAKPVLFSLAEAGIAIPDVAGLVQRRGIELLKAALQQRCSYTFTPMTSSMIVTDFARPVTVEQVKLEAARAARPSGQGVASVAGKRFARAAGFSRRVRRVHLDAAERKVASALDGQAPLQQVAGRAGLPLEQALVAVRALQSVGLADELYAQDSARPIHVVLIGERPDFSESLRQGISQHRSLASYRVLTPAEAEQSQEPCDLMVVGSLAGDDTAQLLAKTRQKFQGAIAVISGHEEGDSQQRWIDLGANLVLTKPVHVPTLCGLL
jgi:CheY-like chemotaxis protein